MPAANAGAAGREARTAAWRKSSAEGRSPTRRARCAAAVSAVPAGAPSTAVRCQSGCRRRSRSARRIIVRLLHGIADRVGFLLHGVACSVGFLLDRLAKALRPFLHRALGFVELGAQLGKLAFAIELSSQVAQVALGLACPARSEEQTSELQS